MSQSFTISDPSSGMSLFRAENGNALEALRSSFSGTAFPTTPAPVAGQLCYRTDLAPLSGVGTWFIFDGTAWWPLTVIDAVVGSNATTGTVEETMRTKTLSAGLKLDADGKGVEVEAVVVFAANANNKQAKITFDGTVIVDTGAVAFNNVSVRLRARIFRTSATAQSAWGEARCTNKATMTDVETQSNPGKTLSGDLAVALKLTTPTSAGDATVTYWRVSPIF